MTNPGGINQWDGSGKSIDSTILRDEAIVGKPSLFGSASERAALGIEAETYVARASEMINRARAIVTGDRIQAIDLLIEKRVKLCDHFSRYQRFKHTEIFNPAIENAPASSKVVARTMKIDCMALGETFAGYHNR